MISMTPQKPYLIRAIYEWILDNGCTPYLLVNVLIDKVTVPLQYVKDNRIVLNLAPDAIHQLKMDNDWISFSARFSGKPMDLFIPIEAVQAIYAKENNEGMFFPEDSHNPQPPEPTKPKTVPKISKPSLKVVK